MKPSVIPFPVEFKFINGESKLNNSTEVFVSDDKNIPESGYSLSLDSNRLHISKSSDDGEFYARQTIKQIISTTDGTCNNFIIKDYPKFKYRGFMIDSCRHFYGVEDLKKIIDVAALLKLNKFHWHLSDDQGWRLPVDGMPELCEIGGKRFHSNFRKIFEDGEYEASFSKDEISEIVKYCEERFIEVIPEIDMPGHMTAAIATYPQLSCTGEKVEVEVKEGIFKNVLCLGKSETMVFVKKVLDSVCDLFPGKYIHIGGDEAPRDHWMKCPDCSKRMKELNLPTYDALQGIFIKEVSEYLKSKGKVAISWNESLKGGVLKTDDVIIQRWMEKGNRTYDFANRGGKVIESDFYHYYFDYPYGMTPLSKVYKFNPINKKITNPDSVIGVECEMWTEYVRTFDNLCFKFFPRTFAVAETAWSDCKKQSYSDFALRAEALRPLIMELGVEMAPTKEWTKNPISRLVETASFFKGSFSIENIRNSINNNKESK